MSKKFNAFLLASTALAGSLIFATAAAAQSTGTTDVEAVVVTARTGPKSIDGAMIAETVSKNRNTINQDFIAQQTPGQSIFSLLNLTPGLSFTNNDPYGNSGGNIRLHGQDGAHIGLLIDGAPLNDAGNYAVYSGQQLDSELISVASVNTGSTDVDTVTASSTAGVINYQTRKASNHFGGLIDASYGSFDMRRIFGVIDSGAIGPFGTKAWVSGSYQKYDKYKGPGDLEKKSLNARIDQPIGSNGDFVSLLASYQENRNIFYYNPNLPNFSAPGVSGPVVPEVAQFGWDVDYFDTFVPQTSGPGVQTVPAVDSATKGFYGIRQNPSNTGTIRGLSRFTLLPHLHLTVDPTFNYSLANGGGVTFFNEAAGTTNLQIQSPTGAGRDLNGDGDAVDTVLFYSPSNTNTRRYAINTSLIYDINADNLVRFAYAFDHAHTRQTGEYSYLGADGFPTSVFSAKDGYDAVPLLDGAGKVAQKRDRDSIAELSQYSLEYRGRFLDNRLSLNVGVRIPELSRELHQFCYVPAGSSGSAATCTVRTPTPAPSATAVSPNAVSPRVTFGTATTTYFYGPFSANRTFNAVLPNVGATFKVTSNISVYANYSESQSAPKVDNLYGLLRDGTFANTQPETSTSEDYGIRWQSRRVIASIAGYHTSVANRIVSTRDPTDDTIIDRNVGSVEINGADAQLSFRPADPITVYLTGSFTDARTQDNLFVGGTGIYPGAGLPAGFAPLKGKQLVETPAYSAAGRVTYDFGFLMLGLQGKYTGKRFVTDVNDLSVPGFFVVDLDARVGLDRFRKGLTLQFNVTNLFDEKYYGTLGGTQTTAVVGAPGYSGAFASRGAPRAASVTLKAAF